MGTVKKLYSIGGVKRIEIDHLQRVTTFLSLSIFI